MNYEKQEFKNGQVLTAECLNRMEDGIKGACEAVPPACDSADCSKVLSYGANGLEWIDKPNGVDDANISTETTWSSQNIVDKLCTSFNESGDVVICNPLEGLPIDVTTHIPENFDGISSLTLYHTGKNLWDFKSGLSVCKGISGSSGKEQIYFGYIVILPPGLYTVSAELINTGDYIYYNPINLDTLVMGSLQYVTTGSTAYKTTIRLGENQGLYFYDAGRPNTNSEEQRRLAEKSFYENTNIQIEEGSTATPYEPYVGKENTVVFDAPVFRGSFNWTDGELITTYGCYVMTGEERYLIDGGNFFAVADRNFGNKDTVNGACSHGSYGCYQSGRWGVNYDTVVYTPNGDYTLDEAGLAEWKAYVISQREAGTPIQLLFRTETATTQLAEQKVIGNAGTNRLYSNVGETEVSGKNDPNAIIQDLYNKINALSATMTALTGV